MLDSYYNEKLLGLQYMDICNKSGEKRKKTVKTQKEHHDILCKIPS